MSHFVCLVVLPKDRAMEDVECAATALLKPYDETFHVPPYETQCWCTGLEARKEVEEQVNREYNLADLRKRFARLPRRKRTKERWGKMLAPRVALQKQMLENHPLKNLPSPKCANCEGTGTYISRANPDGKWDWWVIGGRWDGWIFGPERERESSDGKGGFNSGDEHHRPENNTRLVRDIPIDDPNCIPFAVITPDGQWHQSGAMGWWGIVTDEIDPGEWHEEVKRLLARYPDHLAVAVDCHV